MKDLDKLAKQISKEILESPNPIEQWTDLKTNEVKLLEILKEHTTLEGTDWELTELSAKVTKLILEKPSRSTNGKRLQNKDQIKYRIKQKPSEQRNQDFLDLVDHLTGDDEKNPDK